jgi:hypothetical protein
MDLIRQIKITHQDRSRRARASTAGSIANTVRNATKNWQAILRTTQRNFRRCVPFAHRRAHRFENEFSFCSKRSQLEDIRRLTTASTENSGEHKPSQRQRHQCNRCRLRYDIQFGNPGLRFSRLQPTSNLVEFCTRLRRFLLSLRLGFDLRRFGARWNAACDWGAPVVRLGQCTFEPDSAGWANFKAPDRDPGAFGAATKGFGPTWLK